MDLRLIANGCLGADRSWLRDFHRGFLLEGYTLTLVRGLTPREYLDRIGAQPQEDCEGFDDLIARDREFQDDQEDWGDRMFVGVTLVHDEGADWVLALEINGGIEIHTDAMKHATRGTRGVSHFRSPNAMSLFSWWEDGELRTRFEGPKPVSSSTSPIRTTPAHTPSSPTQRTISVRSAARPCG
ncbi:DUF6461 domain-containing protein [Streptomyces sp. NPDC005498]|uniref:DUF6461 domain-containing protein n=1 Tax=Streptomyces sp. NPDC005498 TaxID=3364717 RepID=UPI00369DA889